MSAYLRYLASLSFDELAHWTPAQFAALQQLGLGRTLNLSARAGLHADLLARMTRVKALNKLLAGKASGWRRYETFSHWFSAVQTRAFQVEER